MNIGTNEVRVYAVSPAWGYKVDGEMLEHRLHQEFLADSPWEAVRAGVAWARNRHENLMGDYGEGSTLSSIKVHEKRICRPDKNGFISTGIVGFAIFEWKNDWPGTLDEYVVHAVRALGRAVACPN